MHSIGLVQSTDPRSPTSLKVILLELFRVVGAIRVVAPLMVAESMGLEEKVAS